ncbi:putative 3-oxoacyl-(acyl carrier protein) reductase [Tolypothrix sp. NIES-4075]|uniref:SDR family NAD(P)-dependent oxidoreductase n=1 Tax=Tolypothrix sp. NIES-4075 TaxID=2005459 RepID=UPI000B5C8522|nr:SDR family NAD(P)-dependent oxidoreductase [Tolypothrix sp. NIES-4075]GAX45282.1 putative 3-oxoacyl-(acyl carrier protein) reductase [Tolypothrix sp. NIES-4075]
MDLQLSGKRVLVTGSSSGVGAGIAKSLAWEGASVVVHGRNKERLESVVNEIAQIGGKAAQVVGDLGTDEGAQSVVEQALAQVGGIDILVNNAGVFPESAWLETPSDDWLQIYNLNVVSAVRMIRLLVPAMKEQGWGRIIQISSSAAVEPLGNHPHYTSSKAAMLNMTVSLIRKELKDTGITVNTVSPGLIITQGVKELFHNLAKQYGWGDDWESIVKGAQKDFFSNPTGRYGVPEDVGLLVAFLVSPLAGYINGANYRIDGGSTPTIN